MGPSRKHLVGSIGAHCRITGARVLDYCGLPARTSAHSCQGGGGALGWSSGFISTNTRPGSGSVNSCQGSSDFRRDDLHRTRGQDWLGAIERFLTTRHG